MSDDGLLARLRGWLGSVFGAPESGDPTDAERQPAPDTAADRSPATHVCAVCGTDVSDPETGCPLCGSTDVRERDAPPESDPGPTATATTADSTVDEEATRLRDLRGGASDSSDPSDPSESDGDSGGESG